VFELRGYEWRPWEGMTIYAGTHGRGFYKTENLLTNTKKVSRKAASTIALYPNPTTEKAVARFNSKIAGSTQYSVMNISGQVVLTGKVASVVGDNNIDLKLSDLNNGYYFIKIVAADGTQHTGKILKN
jgi:hypothetical protein